MTGSRTYRVTLGDADMQRLLDALDSGIGHVHDAARDLDPDEERSCIAAGSRLQDLRDRLYAATTA